MIRISISGINSRSHFHDDCHLSFIGNTDPNQVTVEIVEHTYDSGHEHYDDNKIRITVNRNELLEVMKKFLE